ncbi:uncharacterized protein LOC131956928 [Physella acuta]|uniref:uncharacterized protein LOC131956928 n=1 Tax=Physella acuta TaxID=109671 RepID=UPI0027DBF7D2|nr:uncharacterized protein LOC131956928 [Physella acuta]
MDAYSFYLATLRYVMNVTVEDRLTWCDIFKYIPCLRQMLSCCVCGSILMRPHGPAHSICLHHVCYQCIGGRMRLRPSCSWCKDHSEFVENKKLRILIICFKRLCSYISNSRLGSEICKASVNGCGNEAERTMHILREAEVFSDNYIFTPPPCKLPIVSKSIAKKIKLFNNSPTVSTKEGKETFKRKRGRPKTNVNSEFNKRRLAEHAKRLKRRALTTTVHKANKKTFVKNFLQKGRPRTQTSSVSSNTTTYLVSQRPHRERSGKYSIGQLWRETFLEETQQESYPDSGVEVGNSNDDHYPPALSRHEGESVDMSNKKQDRKETRHYKNFNYDKMGALSVNDVTSSTDEVDKPRLTLTISKKRFQDISLRRDREGCTSGVQEAGKNKLSASSLSGSKRINSKVVSPIKAGKEWECKCSRQPNQLTCSGQKCPCFSGTRPCIDCLCTGCKNPIRTPDSAPPLMHLIKDGDSLDHSLDRSMPRLSPIPRM